MILVLLKQRFIFVIRDKEFNKRPMLSGSGQEDFLISTMYFRYFVIIFPWKSAGSFIWTNLNPLYPRMLCAKFVWNWPSASGEEDGNVKSLRQRQRRQRTTDKFWSEKLAWAFGSDKLKRETIRNNKIHFDSLLLI